MASGDEIERDVRALRAIARSLLGDGHSADDAVQDAWVAALSVPGEPPPLAWFKTVVRRASWARLRGRREEPLEADRLAAPTRGRRAESAERVAAAIAALPDSYREVIELRYWEGMAPRVIAGELGLEVKAVKNRLQRALARLRRDLGDSDPAARAALALVAAPSFRSLPTQAAGKVALTAGALTMTMNMKLVCCGAGLLLLGLAAGGAAKLRGSDDFAVGRTQMGQNDSELAAGGEGRGAGTALVHPGSGNSAPRSAAASASEPAERITPKPFQGTDPGSLRIRVADAITGTPIEHPTISLQDDQGMRTWPAKDGLIEAIPVGRYGVFVQADGYDVLEAGEAAIRPMAECFLGTVFLQPGSGVIEGVVRAEPALHGQSLTLRIVGTGRSPGICCEGMSTEAAASAEAVPHHCATCGHGKGETRIAALPDKPFLVDRLVGGPHRLVLMNGEGHVLATRGVTLSAGGAAWVSLDISNKDIEVVLQDANGRPFEGSWVEDGRIYSAPMTIRSWAADLVITDALVPAPKFGMALSERGFAFPIVAAGDDALAAGPGETPHPHRALWPKALPQPKGLALRPSKLKTLGPGRYLLEGVPGEIDAVQVACGPFVARPTKTETTPGATEHVILRVIERCGMGSEEILRSKITSCTLCHVAASQTMR